MRFLLRGLIKFGSSAHVRKIAGWTAYGFFVLAVVEISLQIFYYAMAGDFLFHRTALPLFQSERYAGYMNRPSFAYNHHTSEYDAHYYTNNEGFRVPKPGVEYSLKKPADVYRILLLGPSFAYGWGVNYDKSFSVLLPKFLAERGFAKGRKIQLINAGVPALQPALQLNWYEHVGRKYHPDLVIQFIYGSMAVKSNPGLNYKVDRDGFLEETDLSSGQIWRDRLKQFATVFYAWTVWTDFETWLHSGSHAGNNAVEGAGRELIQQNGFDLDKPSVRDSLVFYRRLARDVEGSGTQLEIVYFPLSYVIYPQDMSRWRHLGVHNISAEEAFDRDFANYLNQQGIPTDNITEDFTRAAAHEKGRLYYWLDIHWTPAGNAVAARAVADTLSRGPAQSAN